MPTDLRAGSHQEARSQLGPGLHPDSPAASRRKLRLAVVSPFLDRRHGTERAFSEVLERLAGSYPCEVHLFAQRVEGLVTHSPDDHASAAPSSITWHRVATVRGTHLVQFIAWFFRNRFARQRAVRRSGSPFDLVLSPGINCSDADVIIVHALFHRLQVLSLSASSVGVLRKLHRKIYYGLLTQLETSIYRNPAVSLAAVSPRTKADLAYFFQREDVRIIPNAVDAATFSPEARLARRAETRRQFEFADDQVVLLLIGNDWTVKGLPALLHALALLPELPLRLLVAGSDVIAPFRQLAASLGVLDRCQFAPPSPDVMSFYAAADLYVSPTLEDSFGMPVAEAMACGLPAITSTFAGISSFVEDGVNAFVLRDPKDSQALAARLHDIYANISLRQQVASAAASKARDWTWDNTAAQVWELLSAAVALKSAK